ncbi:hypothetical protein DFH06DRAFT_1430096 [Mycena polygramma]|nr:hypothetical protein DFH06DRAFT_1430096 [Mycena polygramma]
MPALREVSVLFSADMSREVGDVPPFIFGVPDGRLLTDSCSRLTSVTLSNSQPTDPIFKQLPVTLEALHLVVARDLYIPSASAPTETRETPLTLATVLTTIEHISYLTELLQLSLTLDDFATPGLINVIADTFPCLWSSELGHSLFPHSEGPLREFRGDSLLDPLASLTKLIHLRITLYFPERQWLTKQRSDHYGAAKWFFIHFPLLQSISFTFQEWFSWSPYKPLERTSWATYPRSLFPPKLIPSPPETVMTLLGTTSEIDAKSIFVRKYGGTGAVARSFVEPATRAWAAISVPPRTAASRLQEATTQVDAGARTMLYIVTAVRIAQRGAQMGSNANVRQCPRTRAPVHIALRIALAAGTHAAACDCPLPSPIPYGPPRQWRGAAIAASRPPGAAVAPCRAAGSSAAYGAVGPCTLPLLQRTASRRTNRGVRTQGLSSGRGANGVRWYCSNGCMAGAGGNGQRGNGTGAEARLLHGSLRRRCYDIGAD